MDNDSAVDGDGNVFVGGEGHWDVLRAYVESRKASRGKHT